MLFIDLETNGLGPDCTLLECGMVLTCDDPQLTFVDDLSFLFEVDVDAAFDAASEYVQQMHTDNGLWEALLQQDMGIAHSQAGLIIGQFLDAHGVQGKVEAAGWSVHADLAWLKGIGAADRLSHRVYDVSTLRTTVQQLHGAWAPPPVQPKAHRALADCYEALHYARWFRQHVVRSA